jgi:hypothetical protein
LARANRRLPFILAQHANRQLRTLKTDTAKLGLIRLVGGFHHVAGFQVAAATE